MSAQDGHIRKTKCWNKAIDGRPMAHAFFDTKTRAESWLGGMMEAYTQIHYFNV